MGWWVGVKESRRDAFVAQNLIGSTIHTFFQDISKIEKLEKINEKQLTLI
jgi:hypothetical protein